MSDYSSLYSFGGKMNSRGLGLSSSAPYSSFDLTETSSSLLKPMGQVGSSLLGAGLGQGAAGNSWLDAFSNWGSGVNDALRKSGVLGSIDAKTGMRQEGWGGLALGAASALGNAYMGMKQYQMAKDQFNFKKGAWQQEFDMQKKTLNEAKFDRDQRRSRERPDLYGTPYSSMAAWGSSGKSLG